MCPYMCHDAKMARHFSAHVCISDLNNHLNNDSKNKICLISDH